MDQCGLVLDQATATILGICALIGGLWCFVDFSRAWDERHHGGSAGGDPSQRPGPNDRRK